MAKSIDPRPKPRSKPELPPDLLAAAVGHAPLPPGVTGRAPIPVGTAVVREISRPGQAGLSEDEKRVLEELGYDYTVELPTTDDGRRQLADAIASAKTATNTPPAVLPGKPVGVPQVGNFDELAPEKKAGFLQAIQSITAGERAAAQAATQAQQAMSREAAVPGISQALNTATTAASRFAAQAEEPVAVASAAPPPWTPPAAAPVPPPAPQQPAPATAVPLPVNETGANPPMTNCPHCDWLLRLPDIEEPPYEEKMAFLQCLLGRKLFVKQYELFGGQVLVTFRTLAPKELDVVYRQAHFARLEGQLPAEIDFYEYVNRYRLMLQLVSVRSTGPDGFTEELPDGYSHSTNPSATGVWLPPEREQQMLVANETELPVIAGWLYNNVFNGEELFSTIMFQFRRFNRLVAKLVAMADNKSFWQPTGGQS